MGGVRYDMWEELERRGPVGGAREESAEEMTWDPGASGETL